MLVFVNSYICKFKLRTRACACVRELTLYILSEFLNLYLVKYYVMCNFVLLISFQLLGLIDNNLKIGLKVILKFM
jgi:hypothetical protein